MPCTICSISWVDCCVRYANARTSSATAADELNAVTLDSTQGLQQQNNEIEQAGVPTNWA